MGKWKVFCFKMNIVAKLTQKGVQSWKLFALNILEVFNKLSRQRRRNGESFEMSHKHCFRSSSSVLMVMLSKRLLSGRVENSRPGASLLMLCPGKPGILRGQSCALMPPKKREHPRIVELVKPICWSLAEECYEGEKDCCTDGGGGRRQVQVGKSIFQKCVSGGRGGWGVLGWTYSEVLQWNKLRKLANVMTCPLSD